MSMVSVYLFHRGRLENKKNKEIEEIHLHILAEQQPCRLQEMVRLLKVSTVKLAVKAGIEFHFRTNISTCKTKYTITYLLINIKCVDECSNNGTTLAGQVTINRTKALDGPRNTTWIPNCSHNQFPSGLTCSLDHTQDYGTFFPLKMIEEIIFWVTFIFWHLNFHQRALEETNERKYKIFGIEFLIHVKFLLITFTITSAPTKSMWRSSCADGHASIMSTNLHHLQLNTHKMACDKFH